MTFKALPDLPRSSARYSPAEAWNSPSLCGREWSLRESNSKHEPFARHPSCQLHLGAIPTIEPRILELATSQSITPARGPIRGVVVGELCESRGGAGAGAPARGMERRTEAD